MESFKATCQAGKQSAAGLDGWTAADLSILSDYAYTLIVKLLNAIERGGVNWPEDMLHTRAVFLSEDADRIDDPLAYKGSQIHKCNISKMGLNSTPTPCTMDCIMGSPCTPCGGRKRSSGCLVAVQH